MEGESKEFRLFLIGFVFYSFCLFIYLIEVLGLKVMLGFVWVLDILDFIWECVGDKKYKE